MECKLELSVFRFDAKTDFLPYYKKHFITIERSLSLSDLLAKIKTEDGSFEYPKGEVAALKINGRALFSDASIDGLINSMGTSWTLDPLSSKRAIKDMIINTEDFYQRFDLLDALVEGKDRAHFEHYIIYHYASSVLEHFEDYQGDALLAFAYDMIQKYPEQKTKSLKLSPTNRQVSFYM